MIGLNQNLSRSITATGATGDLRYQLESSLCGPEIRESQAGVD
jgi:hypothetical protein